MSYDENKISDLIDGGLQQEYEIRELAVLKYGNNPNLYGGQRDGFVEGYKAAMYKGNSDENKYKHLESQVIELLSITGCHNVIEIIEKFKKNQSTIK